MFEIDSDMTIHVTRGDIATFTVYAESNGKRYKFQPNDVVRIKVFQKKDASAVAFQKDFLILEEKELVDLYLTEAETKIGDVISKPKDYWYEIELNPYTEPQTIVGYDDDGPKIFRVYPEGRDLSTIEREDIPYVDKELSLTSENPIQNQAVARALIEYEDRVVLAKQRIEETATGAEEAVDTYATDAVERAKAEIDGAGTEAIEAVQTIANEAESYATRAEEAADRAEVLADLTIDSALSTKSNNPIANKPVAEEFAKVRGEFLPLTGGVAVKRAARSVFAVENTALNKATLAYWGNGVFMGEVGVDGEKGPIFRDAIGNEKTLAGKDDLDEAIEGVLNVPNLSAPILETAMTLKTGVYNYNLAGASYTGDDVPHVNYGYSPATVFVRANGAARVVVLWGIKHDTAKAVQINYFASGDNAWSGWNKVATLDDLNSALSEYTICNVVDTEPTAGATSPYADGTVTFVRG